MDYQALLIAVLSSAALTKTIDLAYASTPKVRRLKRILVSWQEWSMLVRKKAIEQGMTTEDWPPEPPIE